MKKHYILLAGLVAVTVMATGCGKDKEEVPNNVQVTATPAPESSSADGELVNMQQSTEDTSIRNVLGEKTATASKFVLINKTGDDVAAIYIRPHTEDDDEETWGEDLVKGKFVLKDGDKAVYYYQKGAKDDNGNPVTSYDIRITYTDENKYECFFRKLPFSSISQLTLRMDGVGEDSLPFATYLSEGSKKEISTLNEVKKRLGLLDGDEAASSDYEDNGSENDNTEPEPTPTPDGETNSTEPGETEPEPGDGSDVGEDPISVAEDFIGKSLESLKSACGEPTGSDYQDEPETGKTGYHYYSIGDSTFTVSTTVDENGNEIVAGVW